MSNQTGGAQSHFSLWHPSALNFQIFRILNIVFRAWEIENDFCVATTVIILAAKRSTILAVFFSLLFFEKYFLAFWKSLKKH